MDEDAQDLFGGDNQSIRDLPIIVMILPPEHAVLPAILDATSTAKINAVRSGSIAQNGIHYADEESIRGITTADDIARMELSSRNCPLLLEREVFTTQPVYDEKLGWVRYKVIERQDPNEMAHINVYAPTVVHDARTTLGSGYSGGGKPGGTKKKKRIITRKRDPQ